jgi:MATE family multidrug resistance protein
VGLLTSNEETIAMGSKLLTAAACFQLADGIQAVCAGALRGVGETRAEFLANVGAHWFVGLPVGYALSHGGQLGAVGLWWGLVAGLTTTASVLLMMVLRLREEHYRPLEGAAAALDV